MQADAGQGCVSAVRVLRLRRCLLQRRWERRAMCLAAVPVPDMPVWPLSPDAASRIIVRTGGSGEIG